MIIFINLIFQHIKKKNSVNIYKEGDNMKIGIYVGSFDPIHIGHINVMDYLINNKYLDKIIILPTCNYWNKINLTDVNIRCNMIKLISRDYLVVDNENNRYQYTYEILNVLNEKYKNDELFLIISADNIISFDKWKNVSLILKNNKVIVLNRDNIDINSYVNKFKEKDRFIVIQDYPFIDISSTKLRNKLDKRFLTDEVYKYIIYNNLYNN